VDLDAQGLGVAGELSGPLQAEPLPDVVENGLAAGLVADQQQAQAVVLEDLQRRVRHVRLGVAGPRHAQAAQAPGDGLGSGQVVGEGVVVEEELADAREQPPGVGDLVHHVLDAAGAVALAAHRLGPQAEGALGAAAAARVERDVGVEQVADEVALDLEIAVIDVHHERQRVHVLERRPVWRAPERAVHPIGEPGHVGQRPALGHFLDRDVELGAADEVDRRRGGQRALPLDGHVGAHQAHAQPRVGGLQRLGHPQVGGEGRRAGVKHGQLVVPPQRGHGLQRQVGRWRIHQPARWHHRRRLGQPGRIPERAHLAARLVARARAPVEALERGRVQEQRAEVVGHRPRLPYRRLT
jgi:hypothetical protein